MNRRLAVLSVLVVGFFALGSAYYFGGHHNHVGSRSFYLEKGIRNLLYIETHEPIDYKYAANQYQIILSRIRFDDSRENLTKKYSKGLERAKWKAKAQGYFELYETTANKAHIQRAWDILSSSDYRSTEEYDFTMFYWKRTPIDENWIRNELKKGA